MKILKQPVTLDWKLEFFHDQCGATLLVELEDIVYKSDQRDGDWYEATCSYCGGRFTIPSSRAPINYSRYAYQRNKGLLEQQ